MQGTIIFGYDVETKSENTAGFLEGAHRLHTELGIPWTIYLTGQTLEARAADVLRVKDDPLLSIGQHTWSHMLLKSVYMQPGDGEPVHGRSPNFFKSGGELDEIEDEIDRTNQLIKEILGVKCEGMTSPWGYYRGLADRPDILRILDNNGIQWIRSNARDFRDCQPTPFEEQPFFYADQGYPEILELGVQGYQDDFYWERFDDRRYGDSYEDYLYAMLARVAENGWVWNICSHDHGTATAETFHSTRGKWLRALMERAKEADIRFLSPPQLYNELSN